MGTRLKQQRRGKGSNTYRKIPGSFDISVRYEGNSKRSVGEVVSLINHTGHTAPLMELIYEDFTRGYLLAPEGIKIFDRVGIESNIVAVGSILKLSDIPEGMPIYNIEASPGDGGRFARSAGSYATITSHIGNETTIMMPSKDSVVLSSECRAQLGVVSAGGRTDSPIMKAGKNFYIKHAVNRTWPVNRGVKMNPVDHPFGGKQHHKGKSSMTSRNAPPGRKVGHIAASRVGRRKGRK